jgi:hypothetical protein
VKHAGARPARPMRICASICRDPEGMCGAS